MKAIVAAVVLVLCSAWGSSTWAAPPTGDPGEPGQFGKVLKRAQQFRDVQVTEQEEIELGAAVSQNVRVRYGVVQDADVHRYVALVGAVVAQISGRPNLPWRFIVLDTDGVNAFAAPGGYIHITRGALGLITNESELAAVLAHEMIHVTAKHTIKAIQKGKLVQIGADETLAGNKAIFQKLVDKSTEVVLAGFGRAEELEADSESLRLSSRVGYAPAGLGDFLARLSERNKNSTAKQGLFASHPEMKERLDRLAKQISSENLGGAVTLEARYRKFINYKAPAQTEVATVEAGTAGLAGGSKEDASKPAEPKKRGFGLSSLLKPSGGEKKQAEVVGSGASRGVDTERGAKGGPVSTAVAVNLKAADIAAFKKEGNLK